MKISTKLLIIVIAVIALTSMIGTKVAVAGSAAAGTSVQVVNPVTAPVPIRDVAALQPFQIELDWKNDPTQLGGGANFTIPAGKRLVIEQISCQVGLEQGSAFSFSISTTVNGSLAAHRFTLTENAIGGGDYAHYWLTDRLVKIYADPGTTVNLGVSNNLGGNGAGWTAVSGYLVNVN